MSAPVGSLVATVPEVLADSSGGIVDNVQRELLDYDLVRGAFGLASGTCAMCMGFRGGHGEHRAGKLAGQSL